MIFCRTKAGTKKLAQELKNEGFSVDALEGDMQQKERDKVMRAFKNESLQFLVSTDVSARGIDVNNLAFVIHHQLPEQLEYYTHRSGRTARAGKTGQSIALIIPGEMQKIIDNLGPNLTQQTNIGQQTNITQQQKFSINVYLNKNCKDAMNIKDFVDKIKLTIEDCQEAVKRGKAGSISNVIIKELNNLKPTERPIHCSDKKRLRFYVKDEDKWEKDVDNKKLDTQLIKKIHIKQMDELHDWQKANPDWSQSEMKMAEYYKMVDNIHTTIKDWENASKKVKKNLAEATMIDITDPK